MNKQGDLPKFSRKNKRTQRELKHVNFDYYIKGVNYDKKTLPSSKKPTISITSSSPNKFQSRSSSDIHQYVKLSQKEVAKTLK